VDKAYFTDYCGYGPYDENYLFHSGVEHCIEIVDRLGIEVRSVLVLGAATGQVLEHFDEAWGTRPWGCEISRWAHGRIPPRYRRRIRCCDMRRYVPDLLRRHRTFDLLFCNALVYLRSEEIPPFLATCSRICGHFHFLSSTSEEYEAGDAYRATLRPRSWWKRTFGANGFSPTRSRYLWRSERCGLWR
jgi:hypothetical protein